MNKSNEKSSRTVNLKGIGRMKKNKKRLVKLFFYGRNAGVIIESHQLYRRFCMNRKIWSVKIVLSAAFLMFAFWLSALLSMIPSILSGGTTLTANIFILTICAVVFCGVGRLSIWNKLNALKMTGVWRSAKGRITFPFVGVALFSTVIVLASVLSGFIASIGNGNIALFLVGLLINAGAGFCGGVILLLAIAKRMGFTPEG